MPVERAGSYGVDDHGRTEFISIGRGTMSAARRREHGGRGRPNAKAYGRPARRSQVAVRTGRRSYLAPDLVVRLRRLAQVDLTYVNAMEVGDRQAVLSQPLDVQGDRLADELLGFLTDCTGGTCAKQGRDVGAPSRSGSVVHHGPGAQGAPFDRPACRRMLPSVPVATSWFGLPATVTRPGLVG